MLQSAAFEDLYQNVWSLKDDSVRLSRKAAICIGAGSRDILDTSSGQVEWIHGPLRQAPRDRASTS